MRVLVYGFGPYGRFKKNITATILRRLSKRRGLKKVVFPVTFHRSQFIKALGDHKPDIVLGLGQCSSGKRLRIETRAVNQWRENRNDKPKRIVPRGSNRLSTTVRFDGGGQARLSRDAGRYVCNYSMYVILSFLNRCRSRVRFGFIHIPHDYDTNKAGVFLERAIKRVTVAK